MLHTIQREDSMGAMPGMPVKRCRVGQGVVLVALSHVFTASYYKWDPSPAD